MLLAAGADGSGGAAGVASTASAAGDALRHRNAVDETDGTVRCFLPPPPAYFTRVLPPIPRYLMRVQPYPLP
eukprot:scaffold3465_cov39-Isochrysis_galbana.AAC.1